MSTIVEVAPKLGARATCHAFGVSPATYFRHRAPPMHGPIQRRPSPLRRLSDAERRVVLDVLNEPRFADLAPAEVYATLLEEGRYLCSVRTMHRILTEHVQVRERRDQLRHPPYTKPELLATGPNQLWSWDITKLLGPAKWTYFYLYVIIDVFSRCVVGWMVAHREISKLSKKLIAETYARQKVVPGTLTVHADRGSPMTAKDVAFLLAELGVTKTHSRPHVSNDNPFSESHFKTFKYRPGFPERFGCIEDARQHCREFFDWYNHQHHHDGLGMLTPADVHNGLAGQRIQERQVVLDAAYVAHPERFTKGPAVARHPPREVWINRPKPVVGVTGELSERSQARGAAESHPDDASTARTLDPSKTTRRGLETPRRRRAPTTQTPRGAGAAETLNASTSLL